MNQTNPPMPKAERDRHLANLDSRLTLIRDRVRGVATGWSTGFYLWGEGGTSKTWSVETALQKIGKSYKLTNSRVTGKGLFDLLEQYHSSVHVLDDVESMLADKHSHGVLRSALWGTPDRNGRMARTIVWQTATKRREIVFSGGVIIIANTPLDQIPTLRALGTRISVLHHQPTPEEITSLMYKLADDGFSFNGYSLSPTACHEIVEEVLYLSGFLGKPLDIRLFINGRMDRLQYEAKACETHWTELLEARVKQRIDMKTESEKAAAIAKRVI